MEVTPVVPGTCLMISTTRSRQSHPAGPDLAQVWRLADPGDYRAGDIESGVGAGEMDEAAGEQDTEAQQHHRKRQLQHHEPGAQIPSANGKCRLTLFHGESQIGIRSAQCRRQRREEQRQQCCCQGIKKQPPVILEMEFEWKIVSRWPADVAEPTAQQRVDGETGGGSQCHQDDAFGKQLADDIAAAGAERCESPSRAAGQRRVPTAGRPRSGTRSATVAPRCRRA